MYEIRKHPMDLVLVCGWNADYREAKRLIEEGVNIHYNEEEALRLAAAHGRLNIVKLLVEAGADINARGGEALIHAAYSGHYGVVKYLVGRGADVRAGNNAAIIWAAAHGHLRILKLLISKGADIHVLDDFPLRFALQGKRTGKDFAGQLGTRDDILQEDLDKQFPVIRYLIRKGADVRAIPKLLIKPILNRLSKKELLPFLTSSDSEIREAAKERFEMGNSRKR
jgi:hypothetical protein